MHESRRLSRETGSFVRVTAGSRSLERGIQLLRAFLEGAPSLSNSELAARSALPKATVSRLTRSLVDAGLLDYDAQQESYRLGACCLSLGRAFQFARSDLQGANGALKAFAREYEVNTGLSSPDQIHMVYVSTFREMRGPHNRHIVAGGRLPMASSSPGIAYLAQLDDSARGRIYALMQAHHGPAWARVRSSLDKAQRDARANGYSYAQSPFATCGVGVVVNGPDNMRYAINASFSATTGLAPPMTVDELGRKLQQLAADVEAAWKLPG